MVVCSEKLREVSTFTLKGQPIDSVHEIEILGMVQLTVPRPTLRKESRNAAGLIMH